MWLMDEQCQFPVAQIAPSLTCSNLEKPHSGLVESLRILPWCFRKRMSDVSMQWPWLQFPHLSVFSIAQKLLLPSFFAQRSSLPPRMFSRDCVPPSAWTLIVKSSALGPPNKIPIRVGCRVSGMEADQWKFDPITNIVDIFTTDDHCQRRKLLYTTHSMIRYRSYKCNL